MNILHPALTAELPRIASEFANAQPFRHVLVDDFLDPALAAQLLTDFPGFEERYAKNEIGLVGGKAVRMDMPDVSPAYAALDRYLQSPEFLAMVSRITGIPDLLYDPDYVGGGTHENVHGQGLDAHVDFNMLPKSGWHRRLNLIVYLNHEWQQDWGGCLDLHKDPWSPETDQVKTVLPLFNRCVIFETNEISWHGFSAIDLPEDKRRLSRKSLAIYLYTKDRPAHETAPSHGTIYVPAGLPKDIQAGQTLTEVQWLELRRRYAQLRGQLKFLYQRELKFSRDYDEILMALHELQASGGLPLQGFVVPEGVASGFWPDGWIGQRFEFGFRTTRKASELKLELWVPGQLAGNQELAIEIDGRGYSLTLAPGQRTTVKHVGNWAAGQGCKVSIRASRSWQPSTGGESRDGRPLAYKLIEAIVE
jgi:hypothetical protein